jgi:hypothetical protein
LSPNAKKQSPTVKTRNVRRDDHDRVIRSFVAAVVLGSIVALVPITIAEAGLAPSQKQVTQEYKNSVTCGAAVWHSHKRVTVKVFNICAHGVVVTPNPCPSGQRGEFVDVGPRPSFLMEVNNWTTVYSLHIGAKPHPIPKSEESSDNGPTAADADAGCK